MVMKVKAYAQVPECSAGKGRFTVDIRSPDALKLVAMREAVEQRAHALCATLGVGYEVEAIGQ